MGRSAIMSLEGTTPLEVIEALDPLVLSSVLDPRLADPSVLELVGCGTAITGGDAAGALILDRELARLLSEDGACVPFVFSTHDGGASCFQAIRDSLGFFTTNVARTSFLPVQAVTEGKPTVIAVDAEYVFDAARVVHRSFATGAETSLEFDVPYRAMRFVGPDGSTRLVEEGAPVAMSATTGQIYEGHSSLIESPIARIYEVLEECYLQAAARFGPREAWSHLSDTPVFEERSDEILCLLDSSDFRGFQELLAAARVVSPLKVFATAHRPGGLAKARLFASTIDADADGRVVVSTDEAQYGIGLIRDERMWVAAEDIELLQLVVLGREVIGDSRAAALAQRYREVHGARFSEVFMVGTGCSATVRIPCMPANKLFPADFPVAEFARRHGLDPAVVAHAVNQIARESETYHGCRGLRLLAQRPELAELWLETVLEAAREVASRGVPLRMRILLAMTTLPSEVEAFMEVFDEVASRVLGDPRSVVDGISVMLETAGSYILLEDIWSLRGRLVDVNGGLIGSNDFTAACLNFNRDDTPRTTIPGYVSRGLLNASPFQTLETRLVGRAIVSALRRVQRLARAHGRAYFWGLGGELAGDWESVRWLVREAAPRGLDFVSTTPDQIPAAVLSAAQAALHEDLVSGAVVVG